MDQFADVQHNAARDFVKIATARPDLQPYYAQDNLSPTYAEGLSKHAFADTNARAYPIHTRGHAVLSKLYAEKHAASRDVVARIDRALELYQINPEDVCLPKRQKHAQQRRADHYLLPQYRRLPINTPEDVKVAGAALIRDRARLRLPTLTDAAIRLVKTAGAMNVEAHALPADVYKYAGMTTCDTQTLARWLDVRSTATSDPAGREVFFKMAQEVRTRGPHVASYAPRDELVKLAAIIAHEDERFGITAKYHRTIPDAMQTVFNTEKVAKMTVDMGGESFSLSDLMKVPAQTYQDLLGMDVSDVMTSGQDFKAVLETLPADLRRRAARYLKPHLKGGNS